MRAHTIASAPRSCIVSLKLCALTTPLHDHVVTHNPESTATLPVSVHVRQCILCWRQGVSRRAGANQDTLLVCGQEIGLSSERQLHVRLRGCDTEVTTIDVLSPRPFDLLSVD